VIQMIRATATSRPMAIRLSVRPTWTSCTAESVRFTDFHVAPMCTLTRGQLLTGVDAMKNGATAVCQGRSMIRREIPTLANYFSDAGYRTILSGKWHLGDSYPHRPQDRGFQEVLSRSGPGDCPPSPRTGPTARSMGQLYNIHTDPHQDTDLSTNIPRF
jgi:arylsulfatase A-like enzyme